MDPERLPRRWHATGGTFGADRADQARTTGGGRGAAARARNVPASPASLLLDRIAEVCETRHEHAKIRRVEGELPHLLVTHQEDGFIRQWRIAAHVGEPGREELAAFLRLVHTGQPEPGSELVYEGPQPPRVLREEAQRRGVRLRSFIEFQGLLDLRDYVANQTARIAADPLYPPRLYVPQRFRELDRSSAAGCVTTWRTSYSGSWRPTTAGSCSCWAISGAARRSRCTRWPAGFRSSCPTWCPLLIELRALDKAHSVDGLVAAHLANHGEDLIDLKAFRYMFRQGRIVLLFDGFDELVTRVTYERAADHLDTLVQAAEGNAKIVVASRTQHFRVARAGADRARRTGRRAAQPAGALAIEDFTPAQIRAYLIGRYDGDEQAADDRLRLLAASRTCSACPATRACCPSSPTWTRAGCARWPGLQETISAAGLYEEILGTWLRHEEQRTHRIPGTPVGLKRSTSCGEPSPPWPCGCGKRASPSSGPAALAEVADTLADLADGRLSLGPAGARRRRRDACWYGPTRDCSASSTPRSRNGSSPRRSAGSSPAARPTRRHCRPGRCRS